MTDVRDSKLYSEIISNFNKKGSVLLGPLSSTKFRKDPQYILFQMSRYKHVSKLLETKNDCIDIGSGDGIGLSILSQNFDNVLALDNDKYLLSQAKKFCEFDNVDFILHDFYEAPLNKKYSSAVCFDVISSIPKEFEDSFLGNIAKSLNSDGVLVIGTQNKLTTKYSKKENLLEQPNFKTYEDLRDYVSDKFENTIILSMNDETIHTGKRENAQYFLAIGFHPLR
tara:strand:- start:397 stop:1071 length:675 start_codon:yes stop_codon:yes gene_type:complete